MNKITDKILNNYTPKMALVVYASDVNWNDAYLESHAINEKGQLLEGKPLLQETIQGIVDVFFDDRISRTAMSGLLPANLLAFEVMPGGKYRMAWHRPAERRVLHFTPNLKIASGEAWVPAMLYVTDSRGLDVFALASNDRPEETTPLLQAPYHNVYDGGSVCLGSAKVKKPTTQTYASIMKYWEDMFWLSEFNHLLGESPVKTNINVLWPRLINDPTLTWEQLDELIPANKTIKKLHL